MTKINDAVTPASIGGSGTDAGENAGKVRTMGIELAANYDPGLHKGWAVKVPMYFAATGTDAEYRTDGDTGSESIWAGAKKGNKVSYIPDFMISFGIGALYKKMSASLDANYVTEAFADGANTSTNADTSGTANERFGKIDGRLVMDATFGYQWSDKVRLFSNLKNITNETYIVSRQPHGPRPGLPFTAMAGLEFSL